MIICRAGTGIGNRLQAILSLHRLHVLYNCPFYFVWPLNKYCTATFNDCFDSAKLNRFQINSIESAVQTFHPNTRNTRFIVHDKLKNEHLTKDFDRLTICEQGFVFFNSDVEDRQIAIQDIKKRMEFWQNTYLSIREDEDLFDFKDVNVRLPAVHFRGGVVGCDTPEVISNVGYSGLFIPFEVYEHNISEFFGNEQEFNLFTDNSAAEEKFKDKYGSRCNVVPACRVPKTPKFSRHAAKHLMLMSQCPIIMGPNSSFSATASIIGNVPRVFLRPDGSGVKFE